MPSGGMPKPGGERSPSATVPKRWLNPATTRKNPAALNIMLVVAVSHIRSAHRRPMPTAVRLRRAARRSIETEGATDEDRCARPGGIRRDQLYEARQQRVEALIAETEAVEAPQLCELGDLEGVTASGSVDLGIDDDHVERLGGGRERQCSRAHDGTVTSPKRSDERKVGLG
jgi:hypothetical protein